MLRSPRTLLVATLVALHAAVSLGGAGLHALPGWGHESELRRLARNDHSHGPGKSSHQAADDCPVCQFLAQGQLPIDLSVDASYWLVARAETPRTLLPDSRPPHRPSRPRAPPSAS